MSREWAIKQMSREEKRDCLKQPQSLCHDHDKVLDIGDDGRRCQAPPVEQFIYNEFIRVNGVEEYRSHGPVLQHAVGRRHIAGRDGVQHGRQADDGGGFLHHFAHSRLAFVGVADDFRQRAVVTDGPGEDEGHVVLTQLYIMPLSIL